jgi:hypothetical protein
MVMRGWDRRARSFRASASSQMIPRRRWTGSAAGLQRAEIRLTDAQRFGQIFQRGTALVPHFPHLLTKGGGHPLIPRSRFNST